MKSSLAKLSINASNYDLKSYLDQEDYSPRSLDTALLHIIQGYFAPEAQRTISKVKTLIQNGASPHMKDDRSQTLLMKAAQCGNVELVKYFVESGARMYDTDVDGRVPLIHSCMSSNDNIEVVQYLLSKGAQACDKDNGQRTALHFASKNGLFYSVTALASSSSVLAEVKDSSGMTALDLAQAENHMHVVEILKGPGHNGKGGKIQIAASPYTSGPTVPTLPRPQTEVAGVSCNQCHKVFPIEQLQIVRTQARDPKHFCRNCYRPRQQVHAPKAFHRSDKQISYLQAQIEEEKNKQAKSKEEISEANKCIEAYNKLEPKAITNQISLTNITASSFVNKSTLFRTLNNEITDFMTELNAWQDRVTAVYLNVITYLRQECQEVWPGSQLQVFGSYGTGLYLPNSDIDLVITGAPSGLTNIEVLEKIYTRFKQGAMFIKDLVPIYTATIPLLNMKIEFPQGRVSIDITVQEPGHNGTNCCPLINQYLEKYTSIRPVFMILKHFLYCIQLQKVYTGGLSSYGLFLLVVSFYQAQGMKAVDKRSHGQLLFDFFKYYGFEFYFEEHAMYPQLPNSTVQTPIIQSKQFDVDETPRLQIFDPLNPLNNVTRSSNANNIVSAFRFAFNSLLLECKCKQELLPKMIRQVKTNVMYMS